MQNRIVNADKSKLSWHAKIRIGKKEMSSKGNLYPKAVDYFTVSETRDPQYKRVFDSNPKLGGLGINCKTLRIFFPNENCLKQEYILQDKEIFAKSDGIEMIYKDFDTKTMKHVIYSSTEECDLQRENYLNLINQKFQGKTKLFWNTKLSMDFILADLGEAYIIWRFETKGKSMIESITNMFDTCVNQFGNLLPFVPFSLNVKMQETVQFGEKKIFPVVSLFPILQLHDVNTAFKLNPQRPMEVIYTYIRENKSIESQKQLQLAASNGKIMSEEHFEKLKELISTGVPEEIERVKKAIKMYKTPPNFARPEYIFEIEKLLS